MAGLAGYTTGILINSPMPKPPVFFMRFYRHIYRFHTPPLSRQCVFQANCCAFIGEDFGLMQMLRVKAPCKRIDILQLCAHPPPPFQTVGVAGDPFHLRRKQHYS